MRYLNKIVFINSAAIKYAEVELEGNIHLIGTQGVGKSTLLRAILFFYNANKSKLGIPREKKSFDDYYFEYQNSYIIYEVMKDDVPYCVLAYKVNGKVAFRFFNSGYKRETFVDENNRAFENWDKIRTAFGKEIHYTPLVTSYEDFRRTIYGDNKGLKVDFRKYSLIESKQFQNIPRTIQNVFLNSNLEAKFIKDTIINSLNEEEFIIDIENYSKSHLRDFETQINDIKIWFKQNRKGQIVIRKQADNVIDRYRVFNLLKREKKELAQSLGARMAFIEREKPVISSNFSVENNVLTVIFNKKENLKDLHLKRERDIFSEIKIISNELKKADKKQTEYANQNINELIKKIAQKNSLIGEQKTLGEEKTVLKSAFGLISQKYEALISQAESQNQSFANNKDAEINSVKEEIGESKNAISERFEKLINQIKDDNKAEKEKAFNEIFSISEQENLTKRKQAELKHQTFYVTEIEKTKANKKEFEDKIVAANSTIQNAKNETNTVRKEWELETVDVERITKAAIEKEKENEQILNAQILEIENKLKQSKSSLYGWLNENVPNWENTIGKVIDEDHVLFNTELNPKLIGNNSTSFFGIELNLNSLGNRIKTVTQYNQEIGLLSNKIQGFQKSILQLKSEKESSLQKLKTKFKKRLTEFKEIIAESEYAISQFESKIKKSKIELDEWIEKSKNEKETLQQELENNLEEIAAKKLKAENTLAGIKNGIKRKITVKENERNAEIVTLSKTKDNKIDILIHSISTNKKKIEKRIAELKKEQTSELDTKGADTKRLSIIDGKLSEIEKDLNFIATNERTVFEYEKDKRELFDLVPTIKADKISLEKKQAAITDEHQIESKKLTEKYSSQEKTVKAIQSKIDAFVADENKFEEFKKSETYLSVQDFISDSIKELEEARNAINIISELNEKHYNGIATYQQLQQAINTFNGNFNEANIFSFKVKLNEKKEFLTFAADLKEFVEEDKINEYEKRVNDRFANIIRLIGRETTELNSKKGDIEKIIKKINDDFLHKNFVEAIKEMEMRTQESSNPVVRLLIKIQEFNDENSLILGESSLFTSGDSGSKNQKAVELLKELVKAIEKYKHSTLSLSESFDLQFKIVENDNDSGWVEKLSNVGSEGTDVLIKAMINILLLNVFKDSASKKFKDFKLHCMMDEIGRLHPNNVRGILRFANERNILLINGSPTSQNATDYKYTYKLAKEQSAANSKKYITKINRLVKVNPKVLN
jgi:hypothetical protein